MGQGLCSCQKDTGNLQVPSSDIKLKRKNKTAQNEDKTEEIDKPSTNIHINLNSHIPSNNKGNTFNTNNIIINLTNNINQNNMLKIENDESNSKSELKSKKVSKTEENMINLSLKNSINKTPNIKVKNKDELLGSNILITNFDNELNKYASPITDDEMLKRIPSIIVNTEKQLGNFDVGDLDNSEFLVNRGAFLFADTNLIYKGSWNLNGTKEGYGICVDSQGNKYSGYWLKDMFNGKGRLITTQGDYYEGNWVNGIINGIGKFYVKKNEFYYEGNFENNRPHGKGKQIFENKDTYEGTFTKGLRDGKGKFTFNNLGTYEGNFKKDKFCNNGKFVFKSGRTYVGNWKNNEMYGKGEFTWNEDIKYIGDYKENKKEGNGVYKQKDFSYIGSWVNNLPHGKGRIIFNYMENNNNENNNNKNDKNCTNNIKILNNDKSNDTSTDLICITGIFRYGKLLRILDDNRNISYCTLSSRKNIADKEIIENE